MFYNEIHCPFCGSTNLSGWRESFNHRAAFWAFFFLHFIGAIIFGLLCRKRTICHCNDCDSEFSFYE